MTPPGASRTRLAIALALRGRLRRHAGFRAPFGLFTAHVTGNFVLIGAALVQANGQVPLKLLAFPAFISAVALSRLNVLRLQRMQRPPLRWLLALQGLLLAGSALCGMGQRR